MGKGGKGKKKRGEQVKDAAEGEGQARSSHGSQAVGENAGTSGQPEFSSELRYIYDSQPSVPYTTSSANSANVQVFPRSANHVWRAEGHAPAPQTTSHKRKRVDSTQDTRAQERKESHHLDPRSGAPTPPLFTPAPQYRPIVDSQLVPAHLQHPFRRYPRNTTFDIRQAIQSEPVTERHPTDAYFEMAAGVPNAFWADRGSSQEQQQVTQRRKLVVLDLNGALVVRSERTAQYVPSHQRKVFPRPFLNSFLDYLMCAAFDKAENVPPCASRAQRMRPFEVFIWSSAQPKSIEDMVQSTFGSWGRATSSSRGKRNEVKAQIEKAVVPERRIGRILGVWSRSEMGLTAEQYFQKSTTHKDLEKLYKHFEHGRRMVERDSRFYYPDPIFLPNATNTLLIDDSTTKASLQPYNHLPILDFDLEMLKAAVEVVDTQEALDGPQKSQRPADALRMIFGANASDFYHRHIAHQPATENNSPEKTVDGILLAIIGILSEIKDVESIPAWIAAGGLQPDIGHTFTEDIAARGWEYIVELDKVHRPQPERKKKQKESKRRKVEAEGSEQSTSQLKEGDQLTGSLAAKGETAEIPLDPRTHTVPQTLPSHPDYQHWYSSPLHVLYWVRRGLVALDERGVQLQHNMGGIGQKLEKAERLRQEAKAKASVKAQAKGAQEGSSRS